MEHFDDDGMARVTVGSDLDAPWTIGGPQRFDQGLGGRDDPRFTVQANGPFTIDRHYGGSERLRPLVDGRSAIDGR